MSKKHHFNGDTDHAPHELLRLRRNTEGIVTQTSAHYRRLRKGREFEPKHAETLFKDIQSLIDKIKENGIETTMDYNADLMLYVEELAVRNFSWNQRKHEELSSPSGLLEKKRDAYHDAFLIATGKGNPAEGFGKIILRLIEENLEDRVTCTGLLQILRDNYKHIFRDADALKWFSIRHTTERNPDSGVHRFTIATYKKMIKKTIKDNSISGLEEDHLLKEYATSELREIIAEMKRITEKTLQSGCNNEDFIGTLFSNMNGLKKPHNDIEAYKMVIVDDKVQFASVLLTQLCNIQNQLEQNIESWNVATIIERKGLTEFIFKETIGCLFCELKRNPVHHRFSIQGDQIYFGVAKLSTISHDEDFIDLTVDHSCHGDVNSKMVEAHTKRFHQP